MDAIKTRVCEAPITILLDWDSAKKAQDFEKLIVSGVPCKVLVWEEAAFNPKLGKAFHGIERHFSDRIVTEADSKCTVLGTKKDGVKTVYKDDYGKFKEAAFEVVSAGINADDLIYVKDFLKKII